MLCALVIFKECFIFLSICLSLSSFEAWPKNFHIFHNCNSWHRYLSPHRTEDCDDGNLLDGDGCSKKCHVEPGFKCHGESLSQKQILSLSTENSGPKTVNTTTEAPENFHTG